jgi:hypothetical protein
MFKFKSKYLEQKVREKLEIELLWVTNYFVIINLIIRYLQNVDGKIYDFPIRHII